MQCKPQKGRTMKKSMIKKVAYVIFWILVAIAAGLLFATGFQGCYAGEDQHNWIEVEDAGPDYDELLQLESRAYPTPVDTPIVTCELLALELASNQCDFCPLMTETCQPWLDDHTGADGQIRVGNVIVAPYNCDDWQDDC